MWYATAGQALCLLDLASLPDGPPARAQREYLERDKDDMQKFRCAFLCVVVEEAVFR